MFDTFVEIMKKTLSLDETTLELIVIMAARSFILYFLNILLIRINKKIIGLSTPENFTLTIILGSIAAAGIIGEASFLAIIWAILFLTLLNKLINFLSYQYPSVETFFIGESIVLVKRGKIQWRNMKKNHITEKDLLNALYEQLNTDDISKVKTAYLDVDGTIDFIKQK